MRPRAMSDQTETMADKIKRDREQRALEQVFRTHRRNVLPKDSPQYPFSQVATFHLPESRWN